MLSKEVRIVSLLEVESKWVWLRIWHVHGIYTILSWENCDLRNTNHFHFIVCFFFLVDSLVFGWTRTCIMVAVCPV